MSYRQFSRRHTKKKKTNKNHLTIRHNYLDFRLLVFYLKKIYKLLMNE